jgi:hypothetical protein
MNPNGVSLLLRTPALIESKWIYKSQYNSGESMGIFRCTQIELLFP